MKLAQLASWSAVWSFVLVAFGCFSPSGAQLIAFIASLAWHVSLACCAAQFGVGHGAAALGHRIVERLLCRLRRCALVVGCALSYTSDRPPPFPAPGIIPPTLRLRFWGSASAGPVAVVGPGSERKGVSRWPGAAWPGLAVAALSWFLHELVSETRSLLARGVRVRTPVPVPVPLRMAYVPRRRERPGRVRGCEGPSPAQPSLRQRLARGSNRMMLIFGSGSDRQCAVPVTVPAVNTSQPEPSASREPAKR